jgi:hypothetical protein
MWSLNVLYLGFKVNPACPSFGMGSLTKCLCCCLSTVFSLFSSCVSDNILDFFFCAAGELTQGFTQISALLLSYTASPYTSFSAAIKPIFISYY